MSEPSRAFHSRAVPSPYAVTIRVSSGLMATQMTSLLWPVRTWTSRQSSAAFLSAISASGDQIATDSAARNGSPATA